jgi:hypothetical protein
MSIQVADAENQTAICCRGFDFEPQYPQMSSFWIFIFTS